MKMGVQKLWISKLLRPRKISLNRKLSMITPTHDAISSKAEIDQHAKFASQWWDKQGPMKALHALNELRIPFIRDGILANNNLFFKQKKANILEGVHILDVGCGGGILSESLVNLHANVTGIDLGKDLISVAEKHSSSLNKNLQSYLKYKIESIQNHAQKNELKYDAVILSEVIEHITDKVDFVKNCVQALKVGGSIFITTPNKTFLSQLFVIEFAERFAKIVPKGTHTYEKFISPLDMQRILDSFNCNTIIINGMCYNFLSNKWIWTSHREFCYALQAIKSQ